MGGTGGLYKAAAEREDGVSGEERNDRLKERMRWLYGGTGGMEGTEGDDYGRTQ